MGNYVVFTGSFNPVTKAHVEALRTAMQMVGADKGAFVPVSDRYLQKKMLKSMEGLALSGAIRVSMLESVVRDNPGFEVSTYEIETGDSEHTYKTLEYMKETHPDDEIYFLNGADKLHNIPHWNNAEELVKNIRFLLLDRGDIDTEAVFEKSELLRANRERFTFLSALEDLSDASSSAVRAKLVAGDETYRDMLPTSVADLLARVDLSDYPAPSVYDWIEMKLQGGPFDKVAGYKKVYEMNRELFEALDSSLLPPVTVITGGQNTEKKKRYETKIKVVSGDLADVIGWEKGRVGILSEANGSRAGGGYDQGKADTFEEELCRVSTLSTALYTIGNPKLKCVKTSGVNRENRYPIGTNDVIFSSDVMLLRHGAKNGYRELPPDGRVTASVISAVPLDFTVNHPGNDLLYADENGHLTNRGAEIMREKLRIAFDAAIVKGIDTLILCAFGAGFHIPLSDVAAVLSDVVNEYDGCFASILFNVKDTKKYRNEYLPNFRIQRKAQSV